MWGGAMNEAVSRGLIVAVEPGARADEWSGGARDRGLSVLEADAKSAVDSVSDDVGSPDVVIVDGARPDAAEVLRELYFANRKVARVLIAPQLDWQTLRAIWTHGRCFTIVDPAEVSTLPDVLVRAVGGARQLRQELRWAEFTAVLEHATASPAMKRVHEQVGAAVEDRALVVLRGRLSSGRASLARAAALRAGAHSGAVQEYGPEPNAGVDFDEEAGLDGEIPIARDFDRWSTSRQRVAVEAMRARGDRGPWFVTAAPGFDLPIPDARVIDVPGLSERREDVGQLLQHFLLEASYAHGRDGVYASSRLMGEVRDYPFEDGGLSDLARLASDAVLARPERGRHELHGLGDLA